MYTLSHRLAKLFVPTEPTDPNTAARNARLFEFVLRMLFAQLLAQLFAQLDASPLSLLNTQGEDKHRQYRTQLDFRQCNLFPRYDFISRKVKEFSSENSLLLRPCRNNKGFFYLTDSISVVSVCHPEE